MRLQLSDQSVEESHDLMEKPLRVGVEIATQIDIGIASHVVLAKLWLLIQQYGLIVIKNQQKIKNYPKLFEAFTQKLANVAANRPAEVFASQQFEVKSTQPERLPEAPSVRRIGNLHDFGGLFHANFGHAGYHWHMDGNFVPRKNTIPLSDGVPKESTIPPLLTFLYAVIPAEGADTVFASGINNYDRLTKEQQTLAENLRVVLSNKFRSGNGFCFDYSNGLRMAPSGLKLQNGITSERPATWTLSERTVDLVSIDPKSGKKMILLTAVSVDHVITKDGRKFDEQQSRDILEELLTPGTNPEIRYSHPWQEGDLLIWNNASVMHTASPASHYKGKPRSMWQVVTRAPLNSEDEASSQSIKQRP